MRNWKKCKVDAFPNQGLVDNTLAEYTFFVYSFSEVVNLQTVGGRAGHQQTKNDACVPDFPKFQS